MSHKKNVMARDYMAGNLVTLAPQMTLLDAVHVLLERRISGAPVVDRTGNLVGILSEKDCMRAALDAAYYGDLGGLVEDHMQRVVQTVNDDTPIFDVARRFIDGHFRRYPVVQDRHLVGQISRRDVLRALRDLTRSDNHEA